MDKAGWPEFLVYALDRPLAFAIMHLAARLGRAAHLPPIGTFVNDADIGRADNEHLTFATGIHYRLGAMLAWAEAQIIFGTLARRYPKVELLNRPSNGGTRSCFVAPRPYASRLDLSCVSPSIWY
jgi:cytochrome P450